MSGFSADWLRLREPFDQAARDAARLPLDGLVPRRAGMPLQVLDLGCGTGANLRWLAPRLGGAQHWQVFDHDAALLAAWPQALREWAMREGYSLSDDGDRLAVEGEGFHATVQRRQVDLARSLHTLPWAGADLVCASALIDLVGAHWLDALVAHAGAARTAVLLSLNVDGRLEWSTPDEGDAAVAALFARHQRRDKGFGAALGPDAPARAAQRLAAAGYRVAQARSDWFATGTLQAALIEGMALAAAEQDPAAQRTIAAWRQRRLALCAHTVLRVGHLELSARVA
jgi:SAM-dependent methyltransferase